MARVSTYGLCLLPHRLRRRIHINLEPDTRADTGRLFNALAVGAKVDMPLQDMFWGAYFGSLTDQFGIRWMFNCDSKT